MNIAEIASHRHTTKAFDPAKKIPADQVEQLRTLLRKSPSSVNSQPWHFIMASSEAGKTRLTASTKPASDYNSAKIQNASHVVVLCAQRDLDEAHLARLIAQEEQDGRFPKPEGKTAQQNGRSFYVGLHREKLNDLPAWMDRQVYIALGFLLLGAATLGIDACPIEGFDPALLDEELGLAEKGLRSVVMVALGYRSEADFNAALPKSRLPESVVISEL